MVYINNFYETGAGNFGCMKMSHMIADTTEELLDMCDKIGVQKKWIQYFGEANEHFDISISKRKLAIQSGAIEINFRKYAAMINTRIATGKLNYEDIQTLQSVLTWPKE